MSPASSRARPAVWPVATTAVTLALWPTSARSASVKLTGIVAVRAAVSVCSLRSVWAMTPITGTSLVPVMLMVIDFVVLVPSRSVTPTV